MTWIAEVFFNGIYQHIVTYGFGSADPQAETFLISNGQLQLLKLTLLRYRIPFQEQTRLRLMEHMPIVTEQFYLQHLLQGLDLLCDSRLGKM